MRRDISRRAFAVGSVLAFAPLLSRSPASAALPLPASPTLRRIHDTNTLRIAMGSGAAPFALEGAEADFVRSITAPDPPPAATTTDGHRVVGLDVDLALLVAGQLGARLEITLVDHFDALFDVLGRGECDACCSGITRTVERATALAFSSPYLVSGQEIMVRDDARFPTLKSVQQRGVRISAKRGTTSEAFVQKTLAPAEVVAFDTSKEVFAALDEGRVDGAVADGFIGRDAVVRKRVHARLYSVERRRFTAESIAIATRQGDADWTSFLSLVIREAKADGSFERLAHRYNLWLRAER